MTDSSEPVNRSNPRLRAALQEYLERRDRGEPVDRADFLARHAEVAAELNTFLDAEAEVGRLAGQRAAPAHSAEATTHSVAGKAVETIPPQASGSGPLPERFGRYRVIRTLGSGAMGTVYLAEDTQLQRQVALKTSSFDDDPGGEMLSRFYREARSAATLRHNNICPVYDVDQIEGRHFISMAFIEGQPLSAWIKPDRPLPERQTLLIVRKLALALQEAHDHGIIHRDLKPGNVMIDTKGEPIITDFGLARRTQHGDQSRLTQSGMIVGSPAYMSPEQVEAEPDRLTPATDQYSLGVILYEMLTGRLPFGGSITAIIGAILTKQPTPPSELRPGLDPRLEALCLKMMAKSPGDRFPDLKTAAAEMAATYKSLPSGGGASAALKPAATAAPSIQTQATPPLRPAGDARQTRVAPEAGAAKQPLSSPKPAGAAKRIAPPKGGSRWRVALAAGAALAVTLAAVTLYFRAGDAVVKVTIHDPDVKVTLQNETLTLATARDPVTVKPGDGTLKIDYAGLEFESPTFTLRKGDNPAVVVELVEGELRVRFGERELGAWPILQPAEVTAADLSPEWIDLLAQVAPDDTNSRGTWLRTPQGHLAGDAKGNWPFPELSFSVHPERSYELQFGVLLRDADHVILHVPAGVGMANLTLIRSLGGAVIWQKSGPFAPREQPLEQRIHHPFQKGTEHRVRLLVTVAPDGSRVRLSGTIDGRAIPTLESDPAELSTVAPPVGLAIKPLPALEKELGVHFGAGSTGRIMWLRYRPFDPNRQFPPDSPADILTSPDWEWSEPENLGPGVNTREREISPSLTDDELLLVFVRNGEAYEARRKSLDEPFATAQRIPPPINRPNTRRSGVSISGDGLLLALSADRINGTDDDVYLAERTSIDEPFGATTLLRSPVSSNLPDRQPQLSSDGLTLMVSSERKGGRGSADLIRFTRKSRSEPFGDERNLGPLVNTPNYDFGGGLSADGLVLFRTTFHYRPSDPRSRDDESLATVVMCVRRSTSEPFQSIHAIGPALERTPPVAAVVSRDGKRLYFTSRRSDSRGSADLYVSRRVPKEKPAGAAQAPSHVLTSPDWKWTEPTRAPFAAEVNTAQREGAPSLTADERILAFVRMGEIFLSRRASIDAPFGKAERLPAPINDPGSRQTGVTLSGDGLLLLFVSNRDGSEKQDIWMCERRTVDEPFGPPSRMPAPVNTDSVERTPHLSLDGLSLALCSARSGGLGRADLYQFTRPSRRDPFGAPTNLGPPVNTAGWDAGGTMSSDGLAIFRTTHGKSDDEDDPARTMVHVRPSVGQTFGPARPLGEPVDAYSLGEPWLSPDGRRLYFRGRSDGESDFDLWMAERVPKQTPQESNAGRELTSEAIGEVRRFDGPSIVTGVAFSSDGRQVVAAHGAGLIRVRETATGRLINEFGQGPTLRSLACSPHGDRLLTGSTDNSVRLWDVEQGKELHRFEGHRTWVWSVAVSPNGRQGLSGDIAGAIRHWDLEQRKGLGLLEGHTGIVRSLVFSPDGRYALSGSDDLNKHQDNSIRLWDVERGTEVRRFENVTSGILGLAFDAEGKRALSGCRDNTVRLWDVERGKELLRLDGHTSMVWAVAFLPDGRRAISGGGWDRGDMVMRLWDLDGGKELRPFPGHTHDIWSVAVTPDGNYAVSGSSDQTTRLWRLPDLLKPVSAAK